MSSEDPFGGLFGDPDELRRRMAEFAEQMQGAQRVAWADNAIKLAVDMTVAGLQRINLQGNADQQAQDLLQAMRRASISPSSRSPRRGGEATSAAIAITISIPIIPASARYSTEAAPVRPAAV